MRVLKDGDAVAVAAAVWILLLRNSMIAILPASSDGLQPTSFLLLVGMIGNHTIHPEQHLGMRFVSVMVHGVGTSCSFPVITCASPTVQFIGIPGEAPCRFKQGGSCWEQSCTWTFWPLGRQYCSTKRGEGRVMDVKQGRKVHESHRK